MYPYITSKYKYAYVVSDYLGDLIININFEKIIAKANNNTYYLFGKTSRMFVL